MELTSIPTLRHLKVLFFLLLVSIGVYFLSTVFVVYSKLKLVEHSPPAPAEMNLQDLKPAGRLPLEHYRGIWERNLFSAKVDETRSAVPKDLLSKIDALSLTSLNCTLIGTIFNEEGESWAIIQDNQTNRQDRYTVGSLVSGASVVMILRNKVVLNIDGKDELLVMGIEKIRSGKAETGKTEPSGPVQRETQKPTRPDSRSETASYSISRELIQDNINNMALMMSKVRVTPFLKDGKPDGFRLSQIKEDSIFKTMGLQNGDIIKSIDGQNIFSSEDMMRAYNTLKDSSTFRIDLLRNNQPRTLNYRVR